MLSPFGVFLLEVVGVSLTGVMAPGPMTAVAVGRGSESPHAGVLISLGHGVVEFPLMLLLYFGLGAVFGHVWARVGLGAVGGVVLFLMGAGMLWGLRRRSNDNGVRRCEGPALFAGIALSAGNPYFVLWWATVGGALIARASPFGFVGFVALAVVHWSCDLAWLYFLSVASHRGGKAFGNRFQSAVALVSGVFLLFFSLRFLMDAVGLARGR